MSDSEEQDIFSTMCRLCLSQYVELIRLYPKDNFGENNSTGNILQIIERFTTVKIDRNDKLPQQICENCIQMLSKMLAYQNKCKRSDEELHRMMESLHELPANDIKFVDVNYINENVSELVHTNNDETETISNVKTEDIEVSVAGQKPQEVTIVKHDGNVVHQTKTMSTSSGRSSTQLKIACDICGKLYIKHRLRYHMNWHIGLKPYECKEADCTSKFSSPRDLSYHKRLCHFLKPELCCDVCGRGFKLKVGLEMHRSYHFDPKLPCKICEKLFRNTRALNKHMLVHSQERKFKCETCGKSYQTRYTLRIHKRVHTQEKPYPCHCGVSFAYKCLLKAHNEKYHK